MYYDIFYLALKVKTKGQNEGEKMLVPNLRFNQFNNSYTSKKLSDIAKIVMGQSPDSKNYTFNTNATLLIQGNADLANGKIKPRIYTSSITKMCAVNDIIMTVRAPVGDLAISQYDACIGRGVCLIRGTKYLYYYLESFKQRGGWKKISKGSTIDSITSDDLKNININLPNNIEQSKISNFLTLLDKKIELQKRKIDALKIYKKGLLQNLKSNSKDWKEFRIKDLFNITRGQVIPKNSLRDLSDKEYKYPVYSSQTSNYGILGYDKTYDFDGQYLTWTTDGANAGKVFYRNGKFRCTNVCGLLYSSQNVAYINLLTADLLNYETPKYVSYVGNPKLMNNVMSNIKIKLPSLKIQSKISNIFIIFNKKIYIENQKLEKLNNLKKSLLQQMFI